MTMKKGQRMKEETKKKILYGFIMAAALVIVFLFARNREYIFGDQGTDEQMEVDTDTEDYTGNRDTYQGEKNIDTIDIPGFDAMNFQADVTTQRVNLYNPEENSCYFRISLLLEDRTQLYESKLISPGQALYTIELERTLAEGIYENAILKYECFAMNEDQTPLNGSEIRFTLNVLK